MLQTDVEICNLALGHLGKPFIVSLNQQGAEAQKCRLYYPICRHMALRRSDWTFARKTAALAQVANTLSDFWVYAYDKPSDVLQVRWVAPSPDGRDKVKEYGLESGLIYCQFSPAYLRYTRDSTDVEAWPAEFQNAIAAKMAAYMAPVFTRRRSDIAALDEMWRTEIGAAAEIDAAQEHVSYTEENAYADEAVGRRYHDARPQADGSSFWD